jgi:hypothetical protein
MPTNRIFPFVVQAHRFRPATYARDGSRKVARRALEIPEACGGDEDRENCLVHLDNRVDFRRGGRHRSTVSEESQCSQWNGKQRIR